MTETKTPIGQRIIWARKRKGISQERLADMIGTSRRHMLRIETGKVKRPGDAFLSLIAEATDQPVEFFADADEKTTADEDEDSSEMVAVLMPSRYLRRLIREEINAQAVSA